MGCDGTLRDRGGARPDLDGLYSFDAIRTLLIQYAVGKTRIHEVLAQLGITPVDLHLDS
jgi:hypothetical protein